MKRKQSLFIRTFPYISSILIVSSLILWYNIIKHFYVFKKEETRNMTVSEIRYRLYSKIEVMRVLNKIKNSQYDVVFWPHYITDLSTNTLRAKGFSISRSSTGKYLPDAFPVKQERGDSTTIYCNMHLPKGA